MWQYYALALVPIASVAVLKIQKNKNSDKITVTLFFSLLLLLLSLRAVSVGIDLGAYKYFFERYSVQTWGAILSTRIEPAFAVFNKLISEFTLNFQWTIVVTSLLTVVPVAVVYYMECEDAAVTIAIFLSMSTFIMMFSGIRQSIAMGLGMLAYICTKNKKWFIFILLVVLAFLFHRSSFILIFMYPLYHAKITKKSLVFIIPAFGIMLVFNRQIFSLLANLISDMYDTSIELTGAYSMLVLFIIMAAMTFIIPDDDEVDIDFSGLRNILLFSVMLQVFAAVNPLAMRMNYYFILFTPLTMSQTIARTSFRWNQVATLAKYSMIGFFLLYFFFIILRGNPLNIVPYRFFWE